MSVPLTTEQIADLVNYTEKDLARTKVTDIASELRDYPGAQDYLRKSVRRMRGGTGVQRQLMTTKQANARTTGLFDTDTVNAKDVLKSITGPWAHYTNGHVWERRELLMNNVGGSKEIVNVIKTRKEAGMLGMIELLESAFWGQPASPTVSPAEAYGIGYWFPVPTSATASFQIGNHPTFGSLGGLSSVDVPKWSSWGATYTSVSKSDLVKKLREGFRRTRFRTPLNLAENTGARAVKIYTVLSVIMAMEDLAEKQNDNLGNQLGAMDERTTFRRVPMVEVEEWENNPSNPYFNLNPVLMLDWGTVEIYGLRGDWFTTSPARALAHQHNTIAQFTDLTWNIIINNRRRNALFTLPAA